MRFVWFARTLGGVTRELKNHPFRKHYDPAWTELKTDMQVKQVRYMKTAKADEVYMTHFQIAKVSERLEKKRRKKCSEKWIQKT